MEAQFAIVKRFPEVCEKQIPEPAAQHMLREKERWLSATNPCCAVRADAAARHDAVKMRMKQQPPTIP
jgi:hypothetical protein